jgi:hypothetical protein
MASSVIRLKKNGIANFAKTTNNPNTLLTASKHSSTILESPKKLEEIKPFGYPISKTIFSPIGSTVKSDLPFRVRFTTINIEGYSRSNPAPIGIAVIGVNNYIL